MLFTSSKDLEYSKYSLCLGGANGHKEGVLEAMK